MDKILYIMHICITNLNPSKLRRYKIKKNTKFSFFSLSPFLSLLLSFSNKFKSFPIKVAKNLKKQNSNTNSIVKNYSLSLSLFDLHSTIYFLENRKREDRIRLCLVVYRLSARKFLFEIQEKSEEEEEEEFRFLLPRKKEFFLSPFPPLWYVRLNRFFQTAVPMKYSQNGSPPPQPFENTESCKTNNFNERKRGTGIRLFFRGRGRDRIRKRFCTRARPRVNSWGRIRE